MNKNTEECDSRFINFNIQVDTNSDLYKVVHKFSYEQSLKLQKRKDAVKRQANALEKIILNLLRGYGVYRLTLQKVKADKSTRYQKDIYKSSYRKAAVEFLNDIGFCTYVLGSYKDKRETNVYPTSKLLSYFSQYGPESYSYKVDETIIINDLDYSNSFRGKKFKVLYEDNHLTNYLRNTLEDISTYIRTLEVDYPNYYNYDDGGNSLQSSCSYHHSLPLLVGPLYLDPNFYHLYRVFNEGSLMSGGRIYGGPWIGMKKSQRRDMTINNKYCVAIDYKSMAIMQLTAKQGLTIGDDDPYDTPGLETVDRNAIKKQVQRMINSDEMPKSFNSKDKSIAEGFDGIDFEMANTAILKHLRHISEYFGTGVGLELMYEESLILITVLQKLIKLNIPVLPLHDAVITTRRYRQQVKNVMEDTFDSFYGTIGSVAEVETL